MPDTCSTCSAWHPTDGPRYSAPTGECRRYAPTPTTVPVLDYATAVPRHQVSWPVTFAVDACHEHTPT